MSLITNEETYEVTVQRIEDSSGDTEFCVSVDDKGGRIRHNPRVILPTPDRKPLLELAYKGRFNALKEL